MLSEPKETQTKHQSKGGRGGTPTASRTHPPNLLSSRAESTNSKLPIKSLARQVGGKEPPSSKASPTHTHPSPSNPLPSSGKCPKEGWGSRDVLTAPGKHSRVHGWLLTNALQLQHPHPRRSQSITIATILLLLRCLLHPRSLPTPRSAGEGDASSAGSSLGLGELRGRGEKREERRGGGGEKNTQRANGCKSPSPDPQPPAAAGQSGGRELPHLVCFPRSWQPGGVGVCRR